MKCYIAISVLATGVSLYIPQTSYSAEPDLRTNSFWQPLTQDELHDPTNPALPQLQNPGEALSPLPRDGSGDQVNWGKALNNGSIKPRASFNSDAQNELLNLNILLRNTGEMSLVNFPHKQHTEWLACSNCHEEIFKSKAGATKFGMFDILNGEYCGRCHGAIAFPLTECNRCHNIPRTPMATPSTSTK